ncbi:MAG TPA: hypothetical protein VFP72_09005 [Kineosporiaceae bacterium]|nr:hypothetical protein [Kineosporiaceae bacterium]
MSSVVVLIGTVLLPMVIAIAADWWVGDGNQPRHRFHRLRDPAGERADGQSLREIHAEEEDTEEELREAVLAALLLSHRIDADTYCSASVVV